MELIRNQCVHDSCRITVLTPCLVRLEYAPDGAFCDEQTERVITRAFPTPEVRSVRTRCGIQLWTEQLEIYWDLRVPDLGGITIRQLRISGNKRAIWRYGEHPGNLRGTARTLDRADGAIDLEDGVMSVNGISILDDSASVALDASGARRIRDPRTVDLYVFGYGHAYRLALRDYLILTGKPPMIPRFALGNWWSRYHPYTTDEYLALMERFRKERIPFSVAVLDMDWHRTDPPEGQGSGWTGYTWNRTLIPDPKGLLQALHDQGLKVTVNLHPADGVMPYEDAYPRMAAAVGMDPASGLPVEFDIENPAFRKAYMEVLHHELEADGVDFFWIDWQQGNGGVLPGTDILWELNALHYQDSNRGKKRSLILSRYAGPGSQRFPVGFSGDTCVTWASLDFQPYFTANATNIGFCWWSHDIGGHMHGIYDEELMARWVEFGVFSPILRLHSTNNPFNSKEPWNYPSVEGILVRMLRLRYALIPYLYTLNWRFSHTGRAPIEPLYYAWPEDADAYRVRNEYLFGPDMVVCPVTSQADPVTGMAATEVYIPEGHWTDLFTGQSYEGPCLRVLYRDLESIPVLVRDGAILVLQDTTGVCGTENPKDMEVRVYPGRNGSTELYEDQDCTGTEVLTRFDWNDSARTLSIAAPVGDRDTLPPVRGYRIRVMDTPETDACTLMDARDRETPLTYSAPMPGSGTAEKPLTRAREILMKAKIGYDVKLDVYRRLERMQDIREMEAWKLPGNLEGVFRELFCR